MKKFFSTETIIRGVIAIVLIAVGSTEYGLKNMFFICLIILGMALLGVSLVGLYQEFMSYLKYKTWELSQSKTITFLSYTILIPIVFLLLPIPNFGIFVFVYGGILLLGLLISDLVEWIIKRIIK